MTGGCWWSRDIAAVHQQHFFSFQLALPNGRAEEKKFVEDSAAQPLIKRKVYFSFIEGWLLKERNENLEFEKWKIWVKWMKQKRAATQIHQLLMNLGGGQQHNPLNHQHQSQSNNQFNQRHLIDWVWFVNWLVDWVDWVVVAGPYFHSINCFDLAPFPFHQNKQLISFQGYFNSTW